MHANTKSVRYEKRRGFQPPWHTVMIVNCGCGELTLRINWRGGTPPGAVYCPTHKHTVAFTGAIAEAK